MSEAWNPDKVRLQVARDLRTIEQLYDDLRTEAVNRAGDPHIPGGAAMVLLANGADVEAWGYYQLSAVMGRLNLGKSTKDSEEALAEILSDDLEPPLSFLASWADIVREERGGEPATHRATIAGEVMYLRASIDWMLSTKEDGEPWFIQVDDFATRLSQVRTALENVLYAGDRRDYIRARCRLCPNAPRLYLATPMYSTDSKDDRWCCPDCHEKYDLDGVAQCWHTMLSKRLDSDEAPEWVTILAAAQATGRSMRTIQTWTRDRYRNGESIGAKVDSRIEDGKRMVHWPQVRAAHDTSELRKRLATVLA